jgi:hypothetical protein
MSFDALAWAAKQNTGSSGTKLVLLGLAECADRQHSLAFPSIAALVEFSSLDRKSVISNLAKLEETGFITDTGRKVGSTKQIKVYKLNIQAVPNLEPSQKRNSSDFSDNSPKNGTRNQSEPVSVTNVTGLPPDDALKDLFDLGVSLLAASGQTEKQARSLLGKWRKSKSDVEVLAAIIDCRARAISNPVEWLEKRFNGASYVSASGYEYRGDERAVMRQAEKRADWNTYYAAKANLEQAAA